MCTLGRKKVKYFRFFPYIQQSATEKTLFLPSSKVELRQLLIIIVLV